MKISFTRRFTRSYNKLIAIGKTLILSPPFPLLRTVHDTFVVTLRSINLKLLPYITIFPTFTLNLFTLAICFLDSSSFASI